MNVVGQGRKLSYPEDVDQHILAWVLSMREKHLAISTQMLRDKALLLVRSHNPSFTASEGWMRRFMRRHNLTLGARTSVSQKLPSDLETKINEFHVDVKELRSQHNFPLNLVGNMDETPMYFDMVPGSTVEKKGAKEVRVRSTEAEK